MEDYSDEVDVKQNKVNKQKKDFLWSYFSYQPCFICPYAVDKCNETNPTTFNPHHCPWLTEWIEASLAGKEYKIVVEDFEREEQMA